MRETWWQPPARRLRSGHSSLEMVHRTISFAFGKPLLILTLSLSKGEGA